MTDLSLKTIDESNKIDEFDFGDDDINCFLKNLAITYQKRKLSNTYILKSKESNQMVAYFSILASQLNTGDACIYGIDKITIVLLGRNLNYKSFFSRRYYFYCFTL